MKQLILTTVFLFSILAVLGQKSNLVVFSEDGEEFTLSLNGAEQNIEPSKYIKLTDLAPGYYKLKIIFNDATISEIKKGISLNAGMETTAMVKHKSGNIYTLRYQGENPIPSPAQSAENNQASSVQTVQTSSQPAVSTSTTVTESTTITTSGTGQEQPVGENINMNMNVGNEGASLSINVNANVSDASSGTATSTYSSTTTTTSTTTSSSGWESEESEESSYPETNQHSEYNSQAGCNYPMTDSDFNEAKQSVKSKTFEDSKLQIAKQIAKANCLLASQVKQIMKLFDYEESKLDFAKYAYKYTYDLNNYYKVNDAFEYELTIEELDKYIESIK